MRGYLIFDKSTKNVTQRFGDGNQSSDEFLTANFLDPATIGCVIVELPDAHEIDDYEIDVNDLPVLIAGADDTIKERKANFIAINKEIMLAVMDILVDEINILRSQHSLTDRTRAQFINAIKSKL